MGWSRRPRERALRKGRLSEAGRVYAITSNLLYRRRLLVPDTKNPEKAPAARIVVDSLKWLHQQGRMQCFGFVVMPEHVHMVVWLGEERPLSLLMQTFGSFTGLEINKALGRSGRLWQKGYFDHRVRDEKDLSNQLGYVLQNPVRAGYVGRAEDWPWSGRYPDW